MMNINIFSFLSSVDFTASMSENDKDNDDDNNDKQQNNRHWRDENHKPILLRFVTDCHIVVVIDFSNSTEVVNVVIVVNFDDDVIVVNDEQFRSTQ